jgi:AbiV family abortive infection protein
MGHRPKSYNLLSTVNKKVDSPTKPVIDKDLLRELVSGAQKIFENAESLFNEARLLSANRFFIRALVLHQISLEECAKIEILGGWATSLLVGHQVDTKKLEDVMASHARKNRSNAYFLGLSEEEELALEAGDTEAAIKAFRELQQKFHLKANTAKNAALYVDFKDRKFVAPNERITPEMAAETALLNEEFLGIGFRNLEQLRKVEGAPERHSEWAARFEKMANELNAKYRDNPRKVMELLLEEMVHNEAKKWMGEAKPSPSKEETQ